MVATLTAALAPVATAEGPGFPLTPRYTLTEIVIEDLEDASALTNDEQIAGTLFHAGEIVVAFLYREGEVTELGTLGGNASWTNDANDRGEVVGFSVRPDNGVGLGFLYSDGVIHDLSFLVGMSVSANGINNRGQVTGHARVHEEAHHAYVYSDGVLQDLGTLGGQTSVGHAINDKGMVTGYSYVPGDEDFHAFLFDRGEMQDLGSLGMHSIGHDINNAGAVTGESSGYDDSGDAYLRHAFLYRNG
jgi:probable HAF family extracellular repeat protein